MEWFNDPPLPKFYKKNVDKVRFQAGDRMLHYRHPQFTVIIQGGGIFSLSSLFLGSIT